MKALTIAAVTALLIAGGAGRPPETHQNIRLRDIRATAEQHANRGPCSEERFLRIAPKEWSPNLVASLVRCAVSRWPVYGGVSKALSVFQCESHLFPWAHNGSNLGVAQISNWTGWAHNWLRRRWFNDFQAKRIFTQETGAFSARANVLAAIHYAHFGGWSSQWSCA